MRPHSATTTITVLITVKNKLVNLAKISTITQIDCLPFTRHQLIIRTSSEYRLCDDIDCFLQRRILKNCWGKNRKFIWVDYKLGIVRDPHSLQLLHRD